MVLAAVDDASARWRFWLVLVSCCGAAHKQPTCLAQSRLAMLCRGLGKVCGPVEAYLYDTNSLKIVRSLILGQIQAVGLRGSRPLGALAIGLSWWTSTTTDSDKACCCLGQCSSSKYALHVAPDSLPLILGI